MVSLFPQNLNNFDYGDRKNVICDFENLGRGTGDAGMREKVIGDSDRREKFLWEMQAEGRS